MKRTGEIVLAVIGILLSGLFAIVGVAINYLMDNPEFLEELNQGLSSDPNLSESELNAAMGLVELLGPSLLVVGGLTVVLGIIGIIAISKNRKPILAGVMLVLAALVIGIGTLGVGFLPAILFLVAGIMSFVRKPKTPPYETI